MIAALEEHHASGVTQGAPRPGRGLRIGPAGLEERFALNQTRFRASLEATN